ncbi:hypothetical protein NEOLI_005005 [Neolecta irregularis DAH-3]|uniref:Uncharacterized protein n=1 Tax=Neolecta irregularis (strain DAH-3) TaxID=1198029 RepID=A0A1U7LIJ1_NEOID|nr:hypothetical protein NEOLI_005005 [Neolecta irregularis DAH-3]|eukprot:OLL22413.1 hypothetical protein NEOLI_005005 [Neolecta irregularis DAH-3]
MNLLVIIISFACAVLSDEYDNIGLDIHIDSVTHPLYTASDNLLWDPANGQIGNFNINNDDHILTDKNGYELHSNSDKLVFQLNSGNAAVPVRSVNNRVEHSENGAWFETFYVCLGTSNDYNVYAFEANNCNTKAKITWYS